MAATTNVSLFVIVKFALFIFVFIFILGTALETGLGLRYAPSVVVSNRVQIQNSLPLPDLHVQCGHRRE